MMTAGISLSLLGPCGAGVPPHSSGVRVLSSAPAPGSWAVRASQAIISGERVAVVECCWLTELQ